MKYRHLILGAGNMAQALLPNYIRESSEHEFLVYTPSKTKARDFATRNKITFIDELDELRNTHIDFLWACFKPQQIEQVSTELEFISHPYLTIVSLLAGVDTNKLSDSFGTKQIIRIMPNTPAQVGLGVNAVYRTQDTHGDKWSSFWSAFNTSGINTLFDLEDDIDIITPFSGSGPAYFFEIARILIDDMTNRGISADIAQQMIAGTIEGAGKMLRTQGEAQGLRNAVTSKNGVTYEALESLKESNLEDVFNKAIDRAYKRTIELKDS